MSASNERDWNPEVAQMLDYRLDRDGNTLTISNVRNFDWQDKTHFQPRGKLTIRLGKTANCRFYRLLLDGRCHCPYASEFWFSDGKQLALSIEIRKEVNERI